jgi:hypothetical protein
MSVPCLTQTSTIQMYIDPSTGKLASRVLFLTNGGLLDSGAGVSIAGINSRGLYTDAQGGVVVRDAFNRAGWEPNQGPGFVTTNALVGAGGYIAVGPNLQVNFQRLGPSNQWIRIGYSGELAVSSTDPVVNNFYGWDVFIERMIDFNGTWLEVARSGFNGLNGSARHHLSGWEDILVGDDAVHSMLMRLTAKGSLAGTANVQSYAKMQIDARGF